MKTPSRNAALTLRSGLATGIVLAGSTFAITALANGYAITDATPATSSTATATPRKAEEGKCGEGKCGAPPAATTHAGTAPPARTVPAATTPAPARTPREVQDKTQ